MRKLTLEERVQRLEKKLIKNEETRDVLRSIATIVRDAFANDDILCEYFDQNSNIKITSLSKPARAKRDDKWNEINFNIYSIQPTNAVEAIVNKTLNECLKNNGFIVDYAFATTGNEFTMITVVLKSNVKPTYYKPGKDADAEWETDSDHKWRKYY